MYSQPGNALPLLLGDVIHARLALAQLRHACLSPGSIEEARAQMLTALEAYTTALRVLNLPVPYGLRDELRMQRNVYRGGHGRIIRPQARLSGR